MIASITKNQETSGDDKFMKPPPDKTIGIKNGQYDKMNEKGYIPGNIQPMKLGENSSKGTKKLWYNMETGEATVTKVKKL